MKMASLNVRVPETLKVQLYKELVEIRRVYGKHTPIVKPSLSDYIRHLLEVRNGHGPSDEGTHRKKSRSKA